MIRRVSLILAGALVVVGGTVWLIVIAEREHRHDEQACAVRGGTLKQTGTRMVPAGKAVFVPVPEYTCKGAAR